MVGKEWRGREAENIFPLPHIMQEYHHHPAKLIDNRLRTDKRTYFFTVHNIVTYGIHSHMLWPWPLARRALKGGGHVCREGGGILRALTHPP